MTRPPVFHVAVVCTGNICRSPIGEQVLRRALAAEGLADRVRVSSAGTGDWHVGGPADPGSRRVLAEAGYPFDHAAQQITPESLAQIDLALACDRGHFEYLQQITDDPAKVALFRSFDPTAASDSIPDPYRLADSEFRAVLGMVEAATPGIVAEIKSRLI